MLRFWNFVKFFIIFLSAPILFSCATVSESETVTPGSTTDVSPVLQDNSRYSLKRRVVIARFSNETTYGKSVLLDGQANLLGKQAADILATRLAESQKFLLFERADSQKMLQALDKGEVTSLKLPADYMILGSVVEFGRETTGKTGVFSRTKKQKAHAKVNVRLVDCQNSRIIFADEGSGEAFTETGTVMGVGTKAGYDSTLNDKAISAAITKVVSNLVEKLLDRPWRSFVVMSERTANGDFVLIGGGPSQGLGLGHRLLLKRRGKTVVNPQTGIKVELPGTNIAVIEVVELIGKTAEEELSRCRLISGSMPQEQFSQYVVEEE